MSENVVGTRQQLLVVVTLPDNLHSHPELTFPIELGRFILFIILILFCGNRTIFYQP